MVGDFELLDAWRGGDQRAADELLKRHFGTLRRFFRNKVDDAAEDLIQQTFLKCVERRDRFPERWSFKTCLLVAARDLLYDWYRAQAVRGFDASVQSLHDLRPSPSSVAAHREQHRVLLEALRRLPVELQVALELYYWEGTPAPQLAQIAGIPEGTVRSRLRRGKELLRTHMAEVAASPDLAIETDADLDAWARSVRP